MWSPIRLFSTFLLLCCTGLSLRRGSTMLTTSGASTRITTRYFIAFLLVRLWACVCLLLFEAVHCISFQYLSNCLQCYVHVVCANASVPLVSNTNNVLQMAVGIGFGEMTSRLILAHVCKMRYSIVQRPMAPLAFFMVNAFLAYVHA